MNILITGGAGYIGQKLAPHLSDNNLVTVVDNLYHGQTFDVKPKLHNILFINNDVRNYRQLKKAVDRADVVIPLAALVGMPLCEKHPGEAVDVNRNSIRKLVDMLSPRQRIIFPNTNSGYGVGPEGMCTEETEICPVSIYGTSKCQAEEIVLQHPNSLVFRLATVFGVSPRMRIDLLVNDLVYRGMFHKKIDVFQPNARRNYVHVEDVVEAFSWAIKNGGNQQVYNFGNDEANSTKIELVNLIREYLDFAVTINTTTEDPDKRDYYVSSAKLANLGFKAELSLRYGINELIRYYNNFYKAYQFLPTVRAEQLRLMRNA